MVAAVRAGSASASAEQLAAKPQLEETAVHDEELRIAAEFAEHGFASLGGLLGDLGTLLGDADLLHEDEREADLQRWLLFGTFSVSRRAKNPKPPKNAMKPIGAI